ncbi:GNAT family protein [Microbacterium gorillae]|uniref:hypothetical protein n=1 Tax=Microbacterium gorillae TaxID=1231063 RepID=UPI000693DD80|nr:hypothetical protein [Microbacterium gorillae]
MTPSLTLLWIGEPMTALTATLMPVPASVRAPDASDFLAFCDVRAQLSIAMNGDDRNVLTPEQALARLQPSGVDGQVTETWVIRAGREAIGYAGLAGVLTSNVPTATVTVAILAPHEGIGAGSLGLERAETAARRVGFRELHADTRHKTNEAVEAIPARTGVGAVPRDGAARFALRHRYRLEQVGRNASYDLTAVVPETDTPDSAYRIVQWIGETPDVHRSDRILLRARMVTDASHGEMSSDEVSDEPSLAAHERACLADDGLLLVTAAEHVATGRLVAVNELLLGRVRTRSAQQLDTLVLAEHRGRGLGLQVKRAGIRRLRELAPECPRVATWNAAENTHMLAINDRLGFTTSSSDGVWIKRLI